MVSEGLKYLKENPTINALVLGISGGIDSAVTAAVAREVISRMDRSVILVGRVLPLKGNASDEIRRAENIARIFCDDYETTSLATPFASAAVCAGINPELQDFKTKVRLGNIKARTRMIHLYDLAQKFDGMVLSTDNYTEYLLGFWTLHGDVGDFGFIQELWKTEVYALAEYMAANVFQNTAAKAALMACVDAKPTDGLGVSESDIEQIMPNWRPSDGSYRDAYRAIDNFLIQWKTDGTVSADSAILKRHLATEFKRNNPVNIPRGILTWVYNEEA
jgi:NAD+ synthetase